MKSLISGVVTLLLVHALVVYGSPALKGDPVAGKAVHEKHCAKCHGDQGKGDGPSAKKLKLKMVNWTDRAHMAKLTDDYLVKITAGGGEEVGRSKLMTPYKDKLSEQEIKDVVALVRSFTKEPSARAQGER